MANKLELTWVGKENEIKVEPRILIENPALSNISHKTAGQASIFDAENADGFDNMLIHGDNLLALKALESKFAGKIKCIYIDPPYNTGNAFEQYDDNIEHSIWLNLIRARLQLLKNLLSEDGVIFVQINDDEAAYLKVVLDEVFGRTNYETTLYIKVRHEDRILREDIRYQLVMEQVLVYRKSPLFVPPRREKTREADSDYEYELEVVGSPKEIVKIGLYDVEIYDKSNYKISKTNKGEGHLKMYQIRGSLITQSGSASEYYEQNLRARRESDGLGTLYKVIGMGTKGDGLGYRYIIQPEKPSSKNGFYFQGKPLKVKENKGLPYPNYYDFVKEFNNAGYEGGVDFKGGKKPEKFLKFILSLAGLKKNDIVLDSFLGSGSTAATCMKLGYKWIGIEMGNHAYTHCKFRLDNIICGTDSTGISEETGWKGGGGYRFYELAPTLVVADKFGNPVINKEYNADMLAAAMALQEGFTYCPDDTFYWKQGKNENAYIFTTTSHVTADYLASIHSEMQDDEYLVIACKTYDSGIEKLFKNITVKKIPQVLLGRCEFGKNDYSLNIVDMPIVEEEDE